MDNKYEENELEEKIMKIRMLYLKARLKVRLLKFFDIDSDEMLDEKIKVLTDINNGKNIGEIPNFYDILENYPVNDGTYMWEL